MSSRRMIRVSEAIKTELASLFPKNDAIREAFVTISSVDVTPDLKQAFIFVSVLEPELHKDYVLGLLNKERHDWQRIIGRRLGIKSTPVLTFKFDGGLERGDRILKIMDEIVIPPDPPPAGQPES